MVANQTQSAGDARCLHVVFKFCEQVRDVMCPRSGSDETITPRMSGAQLFVPGEQPKHRFAGKVSKQWRVRFCPALMWFSRYFLM